MLGSSKGSSVRDHFCLSYSWKSLFKEGPRFCREGGPGVASRSRVTYVRRVRFVAFCPSIPPATRNLPRYLWELLRNIFDEKLSVILSQEIELNRRPDIPPLYIRPCWMNVRMLDVCNFRGRYKFSRIDSGLTLPIWLTHHSNITDTVCIADESWTRNIDCIAKYFMLIWRGE